MNQEEAKRIVGLGEELFERICDEYLEDKFGLIKEFSKRGYILTKQGKFTHPEFNASNDSYSFEKVVDRDALFKAFEEGKLRTRDGDLIAFIFDNDQKGESDIYPIGAVRLIPIKGTMCSDIYTAAGKFHGPGSPQTDDDRDLAIID